MLPRPHKRARHTAIAVHAATTLSKGQDVPAAGIQQNGASGGSQRRVMVIGKASPAQLMLCNST